MPRETKEDKIKKNMKLLGLTYEEAKKVVEDDEIIDKGGKCEWEVELTPEQKKAQRKARLADRAVSEKKTTRKREPNEDKRAIMDLINNTLKDSCEDIMLVNVERELTFTYNGTAYKITLSAPRKTKD